MNNHTRIRRTTLALGAAIGLLAIGQADAADGPYVWQRDYAKVSATGDIEWAPQPFRYAPGQEVRYIDYANGSDQGDGSKAKPWKHHPWDAAFSGNAPSGIDTYVFKGGVVYRGHLAVQAGGAPDNPIRLTRDPSWGDGPAIIAGSELVSGWTKGGADATIPDGEQVWKVDLDFAPRTLWMINDDGSAKRIPLARHPNWTSQPEDHKAEWFSWTNKKDPFRPNKGWAADDVTNLKGLDKDFVDGALIYSEFGWVMGTPFPARVEAFNPKTGEVKFPKWTGGGVADIIFRGMRYYLEDKPQYLDDPNGEFWFKKSGDGGTLYLRLDGIDPNNVRFEAGKRGDLIRGESVRNLEISGLDFRWTTQDWDLDVVMWDFSTKPWGTREDASRTCIRVWGEGENITVKNCNFEDVVHAARFRAMKDKVMHNITFSDNTIRNTDVGGAAFTSGGGWGFAFIQGELDNVDVLRNYATNIGFRPDRYSRGLCFNLTNPFRAHIAGNVVERSGAQAINVVGGKGGVRGDVPFVRVLIHQNKAWKTMQNANDFGGIETWQHGPIYTFNNLSHDARGQWEGRRVVNKGTDGFGHAYYLDGGFKNYLFNNIAWGLSNDVKSPLANCSAFQEIHSFQNMFFNNTAYNFVKGSRRQNPEAGRNKFLGNVWQDIGGFVFWHWKPSREAPDANAAHVGAVGDKVDFGTNAYAKNVFSGYGGPFASYLTDGSVIRTADDFAAIIKVTGTIGDSGVDAPDKQLQAPATGDFRLVAGAAAVDHGVKAFVPWSLAATCAEWNFYPAGNDPTRIIDEHWYAREYMTGRNWYHHQPMYPLTAVNVTGDDYVMGALEDWTAGALQLDPARKTYAVLSNERLDAPLTVKLPSKARHFGQSEPDEITFAGDRKANAEIHEGNFLIEAVFKAEGDGLLIGKKAGNGYEVMIAGGKAVFRVAGGEQKAELSSTSRLADGGWHHLIVECDRAAKRLRIYVDGKEDASGAGIGPVSIANDADLTVGGTAQGDHLAGAIDFMRIARSTLAESHTTIDELYAWEFDGPALYDFSGQAPKGQGRDAGAIESH